MRPGVVWIAALAALIAVGYPVSSAGPLRRLSPGCRLAVAGGAGAFLLSTLMTLFALVNVAWRPVVLIVAGVLASVGIRVWLRGDPAVACPKARRGFFDVAGPLLSAAGVATALLCVLAGAATSGDLILFWGPKAEAFAAAATIDAAYLRDPVHAYMHAAYPPLVPSLFAFASLIAGKFPWGAATATFPLCLGLLAIGLPGLLRLTAPAGSSHATAAVIVCCLALLGCEVDIAGNAEMPLLFFETTAMALLVSPEASRRPIQVIAGLLLGGAAATKVEGLPFAAAAAVAFLVLRREGSGTVRASARLLGPTAIALGLWFAYGAATGTFLGYQGYGRFWTMYVNRLPIVLSAIARSLYGVGYGLPFLVPLLLLAVRPRPWRPAVLPLAVSAALSLFFVFTYLHEPDPAEWIAWSASRVFSPLVPLLSIAAIAREPETAGGEERGA